MACVGSLVGATMEVDMPTLHRTDYEVQALAEGAIVLYLYDLHFESEVEQSSLNPNIATQVPADHEPPPPLLKSQEHRINLMLVLEIRDRNRSIPP
jgi:hypothetical protein